MKSKLDSIRDWRLRAARHGYRLCVMAEAEGVSRCWLGTYLKMKFGRPAHALLAEWRVHETKRLACAGAKTADIARLTGFARTNSLYRSLRLHSQTTLAQLRTALPLQI